MQTFLRKLFDPNKRATRSATRAPLTWAVLLHFALTTKSVVDLAMGAIAFKKTKHIMRAAFYRRDLQDRQFIFLSCLGVGQD